MTTDALTPASKICPGQVYTDSTGSHFIVCDVKKDPEDTLIKVRLSAGRTDPGVWVGFQPNQMLDLYQPQ